MRKVAVLGYGTVGSGVVAVLEKSCKEIARKLGEEVTVQAVLDLRDFPEDPVQKKIVHDYSVILEDPEIEVVAEVMGGLHPAFEFVSQALESGKHVVTSNKELVEAKGAELGELARARGVSFLFEASVAGGIPILRTINTAMIQEEIYRVMGILNGTTNYILALMENTGATFEAALADAQANGYAERNPQADIEGYDAARKIAILASMICGRHISYEDIPTQGIGKMTKADIESAAALGGRLKLISSCQKVNGRFYAAVEPMFVPGHHPLATVNSVYNAVMLNSSMLGDTMFYGKGAGKLPTASAVVADIIDCVKHFKARKYLYWEDGAEQYVLPYEDSVVSIYLRGHAQDADAAVEKAEELFGKVRRLYRDGAEEQEFAFVAAQEMKIRDIQEKVQILKNSGVSVDSLIRVSDL